MDPIGSYCLSNTSSINVYEIDYYEDKVLAGINNNKPEWCKIVDFEQTDEIGFMVGKLFVPFSEVMRV